MPPGYGTMVVRCSIRWNSNTNQYHARVTVQRTGTAATKYEHYNGYFTTWADVLTWYATFP